MSDLETFVVATGSILECAYLLSPDHGAIACVWGTTESTAASASVPRLCEEVISFLQLSLSANLAQTPGLAAHLPACANVDTRNRLLAGLALANERIATLEPPIDPTIALTAVILVTTGNTMQLIAAGPNPWCWRVRECGLTGLLPDRRTLAELLVGVGQADALVPVVRDLEAVPGDLYGLGLLHPDQVRALREDGTRRLDRALARCALSPTARHFPLLLARWGHSPTEALQGQVADDNAAPVSS